MGRLVLYSVIAALALFLLGTSLLLGHGGGSTAAATEVSVHDLLTMPERYRGRDVTTEGVLKADLASGGYILTADGLRVVVHYDKPSLAALNDAAVRVTGRFDWERDTGVYIQAAAITRVQN